MSSGIDCGKLDEVLDSIFQIPVNAEKLDKWVNGGEFETVILGGKEVPTLRNLVRQIDERSSQAAEEEINEAKAEIGALAEKLKAKIEELKALTASAETLPPDHPATAYYNSGTGEIEFGIPQGKQGIQGEQGKAPTLDMIRAGGAEDNQLSIIYGGDAALTEKPDTTLVRQVQRTDTSANWAVKNPILEDAEWGFERTPEGKLMWKVGDGATHWNDLPYPSILVDKIYRYRGGVATVEDLPTDAAEGDVYNITSTGANYAWTGTEWDNLGVAGAIDPAPVKGSGNPVASGGVYAALEDMQTDIAATGAPDDVTIIKDESGKLVAQDIAIGGDPTDLASARGYIVDELLPWYPGYFNTPLADFDAATILGRYHVAVHKETTLNAPPILLFSANTRSNDGMLIVEAMSSATGISSVRRYRQTFMVFGSASKIWVRHQGTSGEWGTWREIIADTNIGDGIRVTNGMLSVPEYEGATATGAGTAGLVNPATSVEKDYVYHGDGTWRENTNVKVDGVTIGKDESDVISVIPGGIIDNDTIVLDEFGKLSSKSVPFDGGSLFIVQATKVRDEFPSVIQSLSNGGKNVIAKLSDSSMYVTINGRMAYHFDNTDIVFDEAGFFSFSFQWGHYPAEGSEEHDLSYNIIKKDPEDADYVSVSVASGKIDWVTDTWNYTDVRCILNVKVGTRVQTHAYIPPVSGSGRVDTLRVIRFIGTIFKYPVTNEYQVSNAEYMGMYQTAYVVYLPAASSSYPNENFFDIDWTQGGIVNETPNLLKVVDNTTFFMNGKGLALFNFGLSFSVADNSDAVDFIVECLRLSASGTEVVLKANTMAIRKERLNGDVFSLTVLAPIAEDERVRLRVRTANTINVNIGCVASVSCTILPSITDTSKLEPFTPPTASESGKAGLVPAPRPIVPAQQPLRLLGANARFNTLTAGSFDVSWERANSTNIVLGAVHMGSSMAIARINVAGTYYSDNWTDAPFPGAGLYELRELFPYGTDGGARVNLAWFFSFAGKRMYIRGATGSRAAGTPFMWGGWGELLTSGGSRVVKNANYSNLGAVTSFVMPFDGFVITTYAPGNRAGAATYVGGAQQWGGTGPDSGYGTLRASMFTYANAGETVTISPGGGIVHNICVGLSVV